MLAVKCGATLKVLEGSSTDPNMKSGHCGGFVTPMHTGANSGAVGCGYYGPAPSTPSVLPYVIATATTGAAFFAELHTIRNRSQYAGLVDGANQYIASVVMRSGEIPYILAGKNDTTSWPLDTIAYVTEGVLAQSLHFPHSTGRLTAQFHTTVEYLLRGQTMEGYWGMLGSSDQMRSPRVASLLCWAAEQEREQLEAATAAAPSRYRAAVSRFVSYLVDGGGGEPAGYGIRDNVVTTGMAGLAVADAIRYGVTYSAAPPSSN
jgi:hypothetical protein